MSVLNSPQTAVSVEKESYNIEEYDHSGVESDVFHRHIRTALSRKLIENVFRHDEQREWLCRVYDCLYYHDEIFAPCKIP